MAPRPHPSLASEMKPTAASRVLAVLCTVLAPAAAQAPDLPALPIELVASEGQEAGLTVEVVDAVTGAPVPGAAFRWVRPVPRSPSGRDLLPRGVHWFEIDGAEIVRRRQPYDYAGRPTSGVLRIPVLPRALLIQGRVPAGLACRVQAPDRVSLAPLVPAAVPVDTDGSFALLVRATAEPLELSVQVLNRTVAVPIATDGAGRIDQPPHFGIATVQTEPDLALTDREQAAVAAFAALSRRRGRRSTRRGRPRSTQASPGSSRTRTKTAAGTATAS